MKIVSGILFLAVATMLPMGCKKSEPIVVHRISKERSNVSHLREVPVAPQRRAAAPAVPSRMIVAIAPLDSATWFFKVNGPVDQVNVSEPVWRQFISEIQFGGDGNPAWELPEGWKQGPERQMRFATLFINEMEPPLEMSISSLGPNQDLVSNVNRWRGQIGLDPISGDELELTKVPYDGGDMLLFDEAGMSSGGGMRGPMMGGSASPHVQGESISQISYDTPEGFEPGPSNSIVKARLLKTDGDRKVQISVVEMPADANEWLPNVERWAGEIGLTSLDQEGMEERSSIVKVEDIKSQMVRLIEDGDEFKKATIAIMAKKNGSAWFLKLTGDKQMVVDNEEHFASFVESFKFNE